MASPTPTENASMNTKDLETLKANIGKVIEIISRDGETLLAKVVLVSEEDEDVVYDLVSTTRESQYEKFDEQPAYRITFQEIESVKTSGESIRHR
jgi:succinylglutamate desuccinylase